jgi:hypothetical protein
MLWRRANEQRVMELRRTEGIRTQMNASHVHRTLTGIAHAFCRKHEARRVPLCFLHLSFVLQVACRC